MSDWMTLYACLQVPTLQKHDHSAGEKIPRGQMGEYLL